MAIKRPDIYEHNNPNYAIADSDFVRGGLRTAVADLTALYALSPKTDQLKERSTIVYVTGLTKYYILKDIGSVGNVNGWEEFVAGGSGTLTGATNGLQLFSSGTSVGLGGYLITGTTINTDNFSMYIGNSTNLAGLYIESGSTTAISTWLGGLSYIYTDDISGTTIIYADNGGSHHALSQVGVNNTGYTSGYAESVVYANSMGCWSGHDLEIDCFEIYSCNNSQFAGAIYDCDYTSKFSCLSIPHAGWVTGNTLSASNTVSVYNTTVNYTATTSNDFIGVSGATVIYLPAVPKPCQRISIADIKGDALSNGITVCGCWGSNGQYINGSTFSTINTDYGSITFINNGISWSAVSFIN